MLLKKIIFNLILIMPFALAQAQETPSTRQNIFGGFLSLKIDKGDKPKIWNQSALSTTYLNSYIQQSQSGSVYWGRVVNMHWMFGLSLNVGSGRSTYNYTDSSTIWGQLEVYNSSFTQESRNASYGGWARYVFNPTANLQFFIQPSLRYGQSSHTENRDNLFMFKRESQYIVINSYLGSLYQLTPNWRVTAYFGNASLARVFNRTSSNSGSTYYRETAFNMVLDNFLFGIEYLF